MDIRAVVYLLWLVYFMCAAYENDVDGMNTILRDS